MHQTVFGPNEVVLDDTSRDFSMYILMKGRVQVEKKDKIGMFYIAKEMNSGPLFCFGRLSALRETDRPQALP